MVAEVMLLTKSLAVQPEKTIIDGIHAMVINSDSAGADAVVIAEGVAVCVAAGHPLPTGYFDTVTKLTDISTDEDSVIFLPRSQTFVVA